ncbi:MAG TPA: AAA family ATPase [Pseudomonas sp.]
MIIVVACNKGGAGKSTSVCNLAVAITRAQPGAEVCLVDADAQRSACNWHAEREAAGLEPRITLLEKRDNISTALKTLAGKFDYVLVDVAGRNSRELITGMAAADLVVAPHQCSQLDLDTLLELREQVVRVRDLNPELRVLAYHTMASTNHAVRNKEREEFLQYLAEFPELEVLPCSGSYRKVYRDAMAWGKSVLECDNPAAVAEVEQLLAEVLRHGR